MIIGLLGGTYVSQYSVADVLWKKISSVSNTDIDFKFIPIRNYGNLLYFYESFLKNQDFIGFNVALPWKRQITNLLTLASEFPHSVNVVYKKNNKICCTNTDVIGLERSIVENGVNLNSKTVLILGAGGAGLSCAIHLKKNCRCKVDLYDIQPLSKTLPKGLSISGYSQILENSYDIIINATPVGKYYFNKIPENFSLPISISVLDRILKKTSTVVDMNYFPTNTELLNFAKSKKLVAISGVDMLVYQGIETMRLYTDYSLKADNVREIIDFMKDYIKNKEYELLH